MGERSISCWTKKTKWVLSNFLEVFKVKQEAHVFLTLSLPTGQRSPTIHRDNPEMSWCHLQGKRRNVHRHEGKQWGLDHESFRAELCKTLCKKRNPKPKTIWKKACQPLWWLFCDSTTCQPQNCSLKCQMTIRKGMVYHSFFSGWLRGKGWKNISAKRSHPLATCWPCYGYLFLHTKIANEVRRSPSNRKKCSSGECF